MKSFKNMKTKLNQRLAERSAILINVLDGIARGSIPVETAIMDFVCYVDGYRIVFYPMTSDGTQLGYERILDDMMPTGDCNIPIDTCTGRDVDIVKSQLEELDSMIVDWFRRQWCLSSCSSLGKKSYIHFHDNDVSIDLATGVEVRESDKWRS